MTRFAALTRKAWTAAASSAALALCLGTGMAFQVAFTALGLQIH
jgi:hypothetical protein